MPLFTKLSHAMMKHPLFAAVLLLCSCCLTGHAPALAAGQELPPSVPGKDVCTPKSMEDGHADGVICYRGKAAFFLHAPDGWVNDPAAADTYKLCAVYVPAGSTFDTAPAVIYPRTIEAPLVDDLETIADTVAENTRAMLIHKPGGERLTISQTAPYTNGRGTPFALRLFNQGPRPNVAEAVAYTVHEDTVLIVVLSSFSAAQRDAGMQPLKNMLETVAPMDLDIVRENAPQDR